MPGLLSDIVVGYEEIEPVIVANVALGKNFILIGRHGTCKTTVARTLAQGYGGSFVVYDATKDDILSICGIPKTKALEEGRFEFAYGERTIWDKRLIVIDELGRATKENQNILLEILQERTCFGQKLPYEVVIATMNPETYAASLRLDEALLDRFYAVVPVPDFASTISKQTVLDILLMHFSERRQERPKDLEASFQDIRARYRGFRSIHSVCNSVMEYTSMIIPLLKSKTKAYISNRKAIQLAEEIFAIAAYMESRGLADFLVRAAEAALRYTICMPLGIEVKTVLRCHNACKGVLETYELDLADLLRYEFATLGEDQAEARIRFVMENMEDIALRLNEEEANFMLGGVLDLICANSSRTHLLLPFKQGIEKLDGYDELKRRAVGRLQEVVVERHRALMEVLSKAKITSPEQAERMKKISGLLQQPGGTQGGKLWDFLLGPDFHNAIEKDNAALLMERVLER